MSSSMQYAIFRIDAEQALARIVRPLEQRQIANKVTVIAELRRLGDGALALRIEPRRMIQWRRLLPSWLERISRCPLFSTAFSCAV